MMTYDKKFYMILQCFLIIILSGKCYYLFDPSEHDEYAYPFKGVPGRGYAFVMRFKSTDDLVDVIHENVDKKTNSKFILTPCYIIRMVRQNTIPPQYIRITHCVDIEEEGNLNSLLAKLFVAI